MIGKGALLSVTKTTLSSRVCLINASSRNFSSTTLFSQKKIALIPGDGIGREVVHEAKKVLDYVNENFLKKKDENLALVYTEELEAGFGTFEKVGKSLPDETVQQLRECDGAIFGAVSSPSHKVEGYSSPIVAMRKILGLYANFRPIISVPSNVKHSRPNVDMLMLRENTECLYIKRERLEDNGKTAIAERQITEKASKDIARMAFEQARIRYQQRISESKDQSTVRKPRVTIVHKSNVLSISDGLFRESCLAVAKDYSDVQCEEQLVDSMVYKMIIQPEYYDVVVAPNLYGDILSDGGAALVGGLGVVPSANVGDNFTMVEAVHGSAPDIVGKGISNPIATIRASALLLQRFAKDSDVYGEAAKEIERAVYQTLSDGVHTPDLGGNAKTVDVTDSIIKNLKL